MVLLLFWLSLLSTQSQVLNKALPPRNTLGNEATFKSMRVSWRINAMNDCILRQWVVEIQRENSKNWSTPQGCVNLVGLGALSCNATGLASSTRYRFRVATSCVESESDSGWGDASTFHITKPKPAGPPASITVKAPTAPAGANSFQTVLEWSLGDPGECRYFSTRIRQVQEGIQGHVTPTGCEEVRNRNRRKCTITDLHCGRSYSFTVQEVCIDKDANSVVVRSKSISTPPSGYPFCITPASSPTVEIQSSSTNFAKFVKWIPGVANDCTFKAWVVEVQQDDEFEWTVPSGCAALL
jgi:hypothetical protein